jgi:hypothetical protein
MFLCDIKQEIMSSTDVFYALDDLFQSLFLFYDWVGNKFNDLLLLLGFVGFAIWMNYQRKFNEKAKNDPNQIK